MFLWISRYEDETLDDIKTSIRQWARAYGYFMGRDSVTVGRIKRMQHIGNKDFKQIAELLQYIEPRLIKYIMDTPINDLIEDSYIDKFREEWKLPKDIK